ncbi:MAG TPA: hypothetical protein PK987_04040 [Ferruginibacter sp.]|nr:hypothetical protein [Ferruginibacter sp.]
MKKLITVFQKSFNLLTKKIQDLLNKDNETTLKTLPARWALVPVKISNGQFKNK